MTKDEAKKEAVRMLQKVGIPEPEKRVRQYPHEFSGGMRQRVMIAIAFACDPKILICDEPTTALDVTIQGQILDIIKELQREHNTSVIMITHDLGVVANIAQKISMQYSHLVQNGHPTGGFNKSGGVPGIDASTCLFSRSSLGTERINAHVYGCLGR